MGYVNAMNVQILLNQYENGRLLGARLTATQSFIDELVGVLILRHGPDILLRMVFKGCSDEVRAMVEFVASDRCDQYIKLHTH